MKTLKKISKIKLAAKTDHESVKSHYMLFIKAGSCPDYEGMCSRPQPVNYPCCMDPISGGKPVY